MNNKGFTLIEIVSMTIVISIMTLASTPFVSKEMEKVKKEETLDACYLIKQSLKTYYYQTSLNGTFDLSDESTQKMLDIQNMNINYGKATISKNGQVTGEIVIDAFTCTISGDTEEISCS